MAMSRVFHIIAVTLAIVRSFIVTIKIRIDEFIPRAIELIAPAKKMLASIFAPTLKLAAHPGMALPPELQNSFRHEAGTARRSAARHI